MKKIITFIVFVFMLSAVTYAQWATTVQGVPVDKALKISAPSNTTPGNFDFSDIEVWAGQGSNQCAVVLQWAVEDDQYAYVFGYRWDGDADGVDAVKAIVEADPQLFGGWTDGGQYGTTINGFGWDPDNSGNFTVTLSNGTVVKPENNGYIPGDANGFDGAKATDPADWWQGGWMNGYWSYWIMEPGESEMKYSPVGASSRKLSNNCVDGWMFAENMVAGPWKEWKPAPAVTGMPSDFLDGMLMLNEDWFGHSSSSMNFIDNNNKAYYNVYRGVNADHCLGTTSQYGQIFGDRIFVTSKQSYSGDGCTGGRLIIMDAATLKYIAEFTSLPGGDGRGFCAANEHKGYIGTSAGFYAVDLHNNTISDKQLAPVDKPKQTGDMIRYGNRVFVAQQNVGVVVVDPADDGTTLIEMPKIAGFVVTADGTLYAACSDADAEFVKIDPVTLETTAVNIEGSHGIVSPWGTWKPAQICADKTRNIVYYCSKGGWTLKTAAAYNFDTNEYIEDYIKLPEDNQQIYGQISTDPATGDIVIMATQNGYGENYSYNWVYRFDPMISSYLDDRTIALEKYYWFPSMMLYNDFTAPTLSDNTFNVKAGAEISIDMAQFTGLAVGNANLINYSVVCDDPQTAIATVAANGVGTVKGVKKGNATLHVTADYQGRIATKDYVVVVNDSDGVEDITVNAVPRDVYTMTGVCLMRNAGDDDIAALPAGMYIIGGKKVVIR